MGRGGYGYWMWCDGCMGEGGEVKVVRCVWVCGVGWDVRLYTDVRLYAMGYVVYKL